MDQYALDYRELFAKCSDRLEKMAGASIEKNLLKGLGFTGKAVGKFIGSIPVIKNGQVDEFLQESGEKLTENADNKESETVHSFSEISDPAIRVFTKKMEDIARIYNHTSEICFDEDKIYLMAE